MRGAGVLALWWVVGCGSGQTTTNPGADVPIPCSATCQEIDLQAPLAAAAYDGKVWIFASTADGPVVATHDADRQWDPDNVQFRPAPGLDGRVHAAFELGGALYAVAAGDEMLHVLQLRGETFQVQQEFEARSIEHVASGGLNDQHWVAFTDDTATKTVQVGTPLPPLVLPERCPSTAVTVHEAVTLACGATPASLYRSMALHRDALPVEAFDGVALSAFSDGFRVAWANPDGVFLLDRWGEPAAPRLLDDGRREGDAAHTVGGSLVMFEGEREPIVAFQDQSEGSLVVVRATTPPSRQVQQSPHFSRGFNIVAVPAAGVIVDLGLRQTDDGRGLRGTVFVTAL